VKVLIAGAGVSGLGAAKLAKKLGYRVTASNQTALLPEQTTEFKKYCETIYDRGHELSHLKGIDQMIVSPGLASNHLLISQAIKQKTPVISEVDFALGHYQGKVIGVTGTNGKSTVVSMINYLLNALGFSATAAGNIGDPPSAQIAEGRTKDHMVLELSSYQLEQSNTLSLDGGVFTSISEDHIAHHGNFKNYLDAKLRIFNAVKTSGLMLYCDALAPYLNDRQINLGACEKEQLSDVAFAGKTPINTLLSARSVSFATNTDVTKCIKLLAGFKGLEHRIELIGTMAGQPIYNDSKSTNAESTMYALSTLKLEKCVLMLGGAGKGEDYSPLFQDPSVLQEVVLFGKSADEIAAHADKLPALIKISKFPTLKNALENFATIVSRNKLPVLFSPACASFDEFKSFEHRGAFFKEMVGKLLD